MAGVGVAGTDPKRFEDMRLRLVIAARMRLRHADPYVGAGAVPVDRQRALALCNPLDGAVAAHVEVPQCDVGRGAFRPQFEGFAPVGLGGAEPPSTVVRPPGCVKGQIDPGAQDQRVDIVRIKIQGAVEVGTRLVEVEGAGRPNGCSRRP